MKSVHSVLHPERLTQQECISESCAVRAASSFSQSPFLKLLCQNIIRLLICRQLLSYFKNLNDFSAQDANPTLNTSFQYHHMGLSVRPRPPGLCEQYMWVIEPHVHRLEKPLCKSCSHAAPAAPHLESLGLTYIFHVTYAVSSKIYTLQMICG